MSLLLALDPGASPSRPGCEARGCRSTSTTSVRAYLGRIHPTTIRVCERHRRDLEIAGDLENPVICCYPPCGRTRAPSSRLCAEHDAIIVAAKINIPRKGVISAETLVAIRKAVEAADSQKALTAAVAPVTPLATVQPPADDAAFANGATRGQKAAAELIMEALNGRLAEMPAGVELSLQLALTGVVGLLASERGAVAQRDALAATVAATMATLDELRAPDGAQQPDGTIDTSEATRIRLLLAYWSDAIRSVLPGNAERATGERAEPLASLLQDIRAGLEAAQRAAQPAPAVQADPLRVQATTVDGLRVAVEWALDEAKAPQAASLTDRIASLAGQRDELRAHLVAIREALNVGPASDSDVRPETTPEELARIVRARTECLIEERERRVALAEEVEALKKTLGDPLAPAVDALVAWLSGPGGEQAHKGFKTGLLYALYRRAIEPMAAAEALGGLRALARLILSTPEPFDLPF